MSAKTKATMPHRRCSPTARTLLIIALASAAFRDQATLKSLDAIYTTVDAIEEERWKTADTPIATIDALARTDSQEDAYGAYDEAAPPGTRLPISETCALYGATMRTSRWIKLACGPR